MAGDYGKPISANRLTKRRQTDNVGSVNTINWSEIIGELVERGGLTQPEIAKLCDCGQSTISDLLRGNTLDPRTSTGLLLLGLARQFKLVDPQWPEPMPIAANPTGAAPPQPGKHPAPQAAA
jgi:hypothetical protein